MKNHVTKMPRGGHSVNQRSPGAPTPSPLLREAAPQHAKSPVTKPNNPLGANRHVTLDQAPQGPSGKSNQGSTFTAPRKEPSKEPAQSGYTRMDMYTGGNGKGNGNR